MFPILVVDDSREDLELAKRVFRDCQVLNPLHLLSSGQECLSFLTRRYEGKTGSTLEGCLIFMDLGMPNMSGVQTIEEIRKTPFGAKQWIVMLSGMGDTKFVREGYQAGAKTFVGKPLQVSELKEFFENNERSIVKTMTGMGYSYRWA
jgi:two-component system, response regulator